MPPHWSDREAAALAQCRAMLCSGSRSFDAAARLLPRAVRDPAIALYAFCRAADDTIDQDNVSGSAELGWLRQRLSLAYAGRPLPLPADIAFARIVRQFAIPRVLPDALLEGFAWDAEGRRYKDLPALRAYAVRVAGTVGAMMAVVMDVRDPDRLAAAIDLGVAMQLSNIARDVGEDARAGRLYLPLDWLREACVDPDRFLAAPQHSPGLGHVVRRVLDAADDHYRRASWGIARLPLACRFGIGAASLLYAEIGQEVSRRDFDAVAGRAMVSSGRKAWALAKGLADITLQRRPQPDSMAPEGGFLVDAVAYLPRRRMSGQPTVAWWRLSERMRWLIGLLERLEQRERAQG
jgi:15-cis-phytoene synthase